MKLSECSVINGKKPGCGGGGVIKKERVDQRRDILKSGLPFPSHLWKSILAQLGPIVSLGLGQNSYLQSIN